MAFNIIEYQKKRCRRQYEEKEAYLKDPYKHWIAQNEYLRQSSEKENNSSFQCYELKQFIELLKKKEVKEEWFGVTLLMGEHRLPTKLWSYLFEEASDAGLIYADEDMKQVNTGLRFGAWFKPDESPETLLSFFYYGSFILLRGAYVKKALEGFVPALHDGSDRQYLYDFILYYTEWLKNEKKTVIHIPEVLFCADSAEYIPENIKKPEAVNEEAYWGYEKEYNACKLAAISRRNSRAHMKEIIHAQKAYYVPVYDILENNPPLVSIVIPSKDQPDVLKVCIASIQEKTTYPHYEIIVVDNGSNEENQESIKKLQEKYSFSYLYEPMDFNFSKMCNLGVKQAKGDYILLLNDDMEILQADWMEVLLGQAMQKDVAAVGAKMLYPDSDIIQHAGMTSLWGVGPAHQLVKEHDSETDYYYGRNVLVYDMIGVTAACLMVSVKQYKEVMGFCEDIAISYNDADFCFALHDAGYRNVMRNDVVLFHHESLSRGDDMLSDEKWLRLLTEKEKVYERHPHLRKRDQYHNPNLAGYKHKYFCNYEYPYERRECYNRIRPFHTKIKENWHNDCLMITVEHAKLMRKLRLDESEDAYWIEGWAYVLNMDSSRYKRVLLLIDEKGQMFEVDFFDRYRQDVVDILPKQECVGVSGFSCRIKRSDLKAGKYQVALLYKDRCSRQRLFKACDKYLLVR